MTESPLKRPLDDELLDAEAERRRKRSYAHDEGRNMVIRTQKQLKCEDYRVGVVCALEFEMSAIRYMLDNEHSSLPSAQGDSNLYILGELSGHNVVVACLPCNQGKGAAAIVTANMSRTFPKVDLRLLVGIGGGFPSDKHDIRLGDVVISMPDGLHGGVVQYDLGKDTEERFVPKGHLSPVPSILRSAVVRMQSDHRIAPSKMNGFLMGMVQKGDRLSSYRKPQTEDILFQQDSLHTAGHETCDGCDMEKTINRRPREAEYPQIHYGLIASGDRVIRSANKALLATRDLGDVLCFEMEAAGVLTEFPCLVIRGISDYVDSHKNDVWQHYAAASAAACSKELLSYLDPGMPDDMACSRTTRTIPEASVGRNTLSLSPDQKHRLLESMKFSQIDARRNTVKRAHVHTCKWLLRAPEYLKWLDETKINEHHGVLWIKGKPGAGKSTLIKFALSNAPKVMKRKLVLCFFFNARGEDLEKSTVGMYRSLLWQLLSQIPELLTVFGSLGLRDLEVGEDHQWSIETLKELFQHAIQKLKQTPLVSFIDALDECDEMQIRDMLRFFEDIAESAIAVGVPFHVLFSSRHYPHITIRSGLELVLEGQEGHNQDIKNYVDKELNMGHSNLAAQIRSELQEKASGVFMWVVLVVEILNKEHDRGRMHRLRQELRDIPDDLHSLFRDILTRDQDDRDQLLLCVQWILLARQPLTPRQLYCAVLIGIEPEALEDWTSEAITDKDIERFIVDCSKGLAETTITKASTVQFIHESVRDFLLKEDGFGQIWPELGSNFQGLSQERSKNAA
ncbi:nucleoside phosphorylase domain-containing protein [Aspergillus undulatus]|uniref:nucleoside phosphorylase domain-containing protein n=1 Tax=Aspergillus undulatus TaxID=1810928 RepID=UPI003CCE3B44